MGSNHEKNGGRKSRDTVPLTGPRNIFCWLSPCRRVTGPPSRPGRRTGSCTPRHSAAACKVMVMVNRVEWFTTLCDFRNWTNCCRSSIFLEVQWLNIGKFGRGKVFIFKKSQISMNIFFVIMLISTLNNNRPKENKKFLLRPQNGTNCSKEKRFF